MKPVRVKPLIKPLLRGHFHQEAFFMALGACAMLIVRSVDTKALLSIVIYSVSLVSLLGISALYHRPHWKPQARLRLQRMDHAAIFSLIAGTGTPIFLAALAPEDGNRILTITWIAAGIGILQALIWPKAPNWVSCVLAIGVGWLSIPYFPELAKALGPTSVLLLLIGGILYTLGAIIYAVRRPNPYPAVFGYHEIFHILVVIAALLHFIVIMRVTTPVIS